jgi:integrase
MRVEQRRLGTFTPDEARRIFEAGDRDGEGWGLAARIAAATGLRYGDIAHLRYGDIRDGAIDIEPRKTKGRGIRVVVPLPPDVAARIGTGSPDALLFPKHARGYSYCWAKKHPFADIMAAAGVEANGRTFHSFRHYFRTQLAKAGVSDEIAMKLGGWTQRTTADRYDHDGRAKEKAAAVAAAWALTEAEADPRPAP